jgi:hypothetical protein
MSMKERRKLRRQAHRAALVSVAAAPSFQATKKKRVKRSPLRRAVFLAATLALLVGWMMASPKATHAASPPPVPEIDPGSMAGALTLLVGGFLALTDRVRRS